MSFVKEFRDFAVRGNVVDMAVGIIIGAAFGKIVSSLVNDVIMPPIGLLMGGVDFSNLFVNLGEGTFASLAAGVDLYEKLGRLVLVGGAPLNEEFGQAIGANASYHSPAKQ